MKQLISCLSMSERMMALEKQSRNLFLYGEITTELVREIGKFIVDFCYEDDEFEEEIKNYEREPIYLYINSEGGSVYDSLALVDIISTASTPVVTFCTGKAMSSALTIFLAGHYRIAGPYSTFMYHEISQDVQGFISSVKQDLRESERLQNMIDEFILLKTNIPKDVLNMHRDKKNDWYIPAEEAVELGIADIIAKPSEVVVS